MADGAKTCLMCGAILTDESAVVDSGDATAEEHLVADAVPETADEGDERPSPLRIAILAAIAVIVLSGSVVLGLKLGRGQGPVELPTFTSTVTLTPTSTRTPTQTPTPTHTPLPTETPTPLPPIEYVVQPGDTLLEIAMEYELTIEEIRAYNELESDTIVEGQTLQLPPPSPTPGPTPTPRPGEPTPTSAAYLLHTVQGGDTLSTIAEEYGVSMSAIREANEIPTDSETIQVNRVLMIPRNTPTPEPEVIVAATPTPTPGLMRYPSPSMLYPPDGGEFEGADATIALQWASVGILDEREYYQVELIVPYELETPLDPIYLKSTVWRVPTSLFPPEAAEDRTFSWRVLVVRQVTESADSAYRIISPAPRRRTFTWLAE